VSLVLVADDKLLSPAELRAEIMRPLELIKSEARFFAQWSPRCKNLRQEALPPLDYSIFAECPPCVQLRRMSRCVAIACQRLATAPAGMHVAFKSWGWAELVMERVTWGRARNVQVRLQRRAYRAVRCACPASACAPYVFDVNTLTRAAANAGWVSGMLLRIAAAASSAPRRPFRICVRRLLLPPALQTDPTFCSRLRKETALRCFAI
jgi:hypothetical protein